jgi:hypothetical protein
MPAMRAERGCVGALTFLLTVMACSRSEPTTVAEVAPSPPPPPPVVRDAAIDVSDGGGDAGDAAGSPRVGKKPAAAATSGGGGPGGLKVEGAIARPEAEQAIRAVGVKLRACYAQERGKNPALKGRVTFKLTINERGFVTIGEIVTSTLQGGSDAENCMVRAARDFRFPRGAGESTLSFAMNFGR